MKAEIVAKLDGTMMLQVTPGSPSEASLLTLFSNAVSTRRVQVTGSWSHDLQRHLEMTVMRMGDPPVEPVTDEEPPSATTAAFRECFAEEFERLGRIHCVRILPRYIEDNRAHLLAPVVRVAWHVARVTDRRFLVPDDFVAHGEVEAHMDRHVLRYEGFCKMINDLRAGIREWFAAAFPDQAESLWEGGDC